MAEAGSVYAEAELNIDKFQDAAAKLEGEGARIANAMDQCAVGVDKVQSSVAELGSGVGGIQSQMSAASTSIQQNAVSLESLQSALDAARAKTDGLAEAYERAVSEFGENSTQANEAAQAFDSMMDKVEGLERALATQESASSASVKSLDAVASAASKSSEEVAAFEDATQNASGAASQFENNSATIASAAEQAATGISEIQGSSDALALSLDAAKATMSAAQLAFEQSESALATMQASLDAARAKTDELGEAYERTLNQFGKGSLPEFEAARSFDEALDAQEKLEAQVTKQQIAVKKSEATFKKAAATVAKYSSKISAAQEQVEEFSESVTDMNDELDSDVLDEVGESAASTSEDAEGLSDVLGDLLTDSADGASEKISNLAANTLGLDTSSAVGALAVKGLSNGLDKLIAAAGSTTLMYAGLAAAAVYGAYKFYDYASGAAAARESLEKLVEVGKQWQETNVTTSFEKSEGLSGYGLTTDNFVPKKKSGSDWVSETLKTWSDGAKETDAILKATLDGFTSGSDEIRGSLSDIQSTAAAAGVDDVLGLDADIQRLDEIDASVEKLLKKRQNGYLTEDEKGQLQSLYDERESIALKYHLVPDGTSGYDEIVQSAEAALRRGESESTVWADAYAAASQGQSAFIDNLNAEYDARYKVIDLMDEGAEKQAALAELDTWYNEQNTAGIEAYRNALQSVATELTGAFEENGAYADTTAQLATAVDAMNAAAADPSPENMQAFTDALAGLDETQVVEMTASLTAMQAAGVEMSSGMTTALESIESLKGAANADAFKGVEDLFTSLNSMFGENLDSEVHELNVSLNTENLNTVYDAWAAGEHVPINANIEPEEIDASTIAITGTVGLNGEVLTVTTKLGNSYTIEGFTVGVDGQLTGVNPKTGQTYTVEGLKVDVDGQLSVVNPKTGQTYKVTGVKAGVDGELLTVTGADGATYTVSGVKAGVDGEVVNVTLAEGFEAPKIEVEATVTKLNFEEGNFTNSANPQLDYSKGLAGMNANDSTGTWFAGFTQSDAQTLHSCADAIRDYNSAVAANDSVGMEEASARANQFGTSLQSFLDDGEGFGNVAMTVANGLQLLSEGKLDPAQAQELLTVISDLQEVVGSTDFMSMGAAISEGLAEAFSSDNLNLGWTDVNMFNLGEMLQNAVESVDFGPAGQSAGQGFGKELAATDVSGDAQTFVTGAREAVGAAEGEGSPATLFMPAGESAALGFGKGMADADVTSNANALIENALKAASGNLNQAASIGRGFSSGLATGISAGRSDVINAAVRVANAAAAAARTELSIHSPSRVTEELGELFDLGFIRGVDRIAPDIRDSIENALYIEPPAGAMYASSVLRKSTAPSVTVKGQAIDYDALAEAMDRRQVVLTMDKRRIAEIQTGEAARTQAIRSRTIALGYGK